MMPFLEHHARGRAKGRERTDRRDGRGHDVPDQDFRWILARRCDLPEDIAIRDQADRAAILDDDQATDFLRRHPFRGIQDRPLRIDDDDIFRHHVSHEDHARTPDSLRSTEAGDPQAASAGERDRRG
jgi:hypothetical protein